MATSAGPRTRSIVGFVQKRSGTGALADKSKASGIGTDSADGYLLKYNQGGTIRKVVSEDGTQTLTNKTLTSPVITGSLATSSVTTLTTTRAILAAESGTTFLLGSATGFACTLPAAAAGLRYTFIVSVAPTSGSHTVAGASGTPIHGMLLSKDLNGATDAAATAGTGVLTVTFVVNKAVKGDKLTLVSNGTDWFAEASTGGNFDAITYS